MFSISNHTLNWVETVSALDLSHQQQDEVQS